METQIHVESIKTLDTPFLLVTSPNISSFRLPSAQIISEST